MNNKALFWIALAIIIIGGGIIFFGTRRASAPMPRDDAAMQQGADAGEDALMAFDEELVVGSVMPLTGDAAVYGLPIQRAAELAVEEINASGGIDGKKLVIRYEDGKCNGEDALTSARKLISAEGVRAIVGGVCSGEVLGMAEVLNESETVLISPSAANPDISEEGGSYVFRLFPSDAFAADIAASFAYDDLEARTVAVFAEQTAFAQGLRQGFIEAFREKGGEVALDESWDTGTMDFHTQALKIKNAGVDAVYVVPQTPAGGIAIVEALRDQQLEAVILTNEVLMGRDVAMENEGLLEGAYGFEPFYPEDGDIARAFMTAYETRYEEKAAFPFYMVNTYSSVYLLKELVEEHGYSGADLQAALGSLEGWTGGALTSVTFDEDGDIVWSTYQVKRIVDGEITDEKVYEL